jgi:hypothetical protein
MTKVAVGIVEYADSAGLYRTLASLRLDQPNTIDLAIVVHSRFDHFDLHADPTEEEALKQTQDVIAKCPQDRVKLILPPVAVGVVNTAAGEKEGETRARTSQIESRNLYLKVAADEGCDWLLVIDSDEFIAKNADWAEFRKQLEFVMSLGLPHQLFDVQMEGMLSMYRGPRPRLFYRPGSLKYWKRHYWIVREEQMICYKGTTDSGRVIGGIYLMHDRTVRSMNHYNATLDYNDWQVVNE